MRNRGHHVSSMVITEHLRDEPYICICTYIIHILNQLYFIEKCIYKFFLMVGPLKGGGGRGNPETLKEGRKIRKIVEQLRSWGRGGG